MNKEKNSYIKQLNTFTYALVALFLSLSFMLTIFCIKSYASAIVIPMNDVPNYTTNYYGHFLEVVPYNSGVLYRGYSYGLIDTSDTVSVVTEISSDGYEVYYLHSEHGFYSRYISQFGDVVFTQNVYLDDERETVIDVPWGSNNPEFQYIYKYADFEPEFDPSIPSPIGIFGENSKGDFDHVFTLQNRGSYGVLMKIRWHSVDDVIFQGHTGTIKVSVNFQRQLDGPIRDLYSISSPSYLNSYDLDVVGSGSFDEFLNLYPVSDRSVFQYNYQGKEVTLYNSAVTHFLSSLAHSDFNYNVPEIFVAYTDGDKIGYWSQYYIDLITGETYKQNAIRPFGDNGNSSYSYQSGLSNSDVNNLLDSPDSIYNPNANNISSGNIYGYSDNVNVPDGLVQGINSLVSTCQTVLNLFGTLFTVVPSWFINLIFVLLGIYILGIFFGKIGG